MGNSLSQYNRNLVAENLRKERKQDKKKEIMSRKVVSDGNDAEEIDETWDLKKEDILQLWLIRIAMNKRKSH